ncbi:carbohydrate binding domain-containing protein [Riemerella anatipestifer]|uniref:galactose-binding protein n=1 Tax=Riemerella anatipestifer TaxID=34085 RepID=UPI0021F8A62B|nr:galactose-binding protein [Riemerella anatipestifer]MCW0507939.1 galactose-binding protein [Riemerella anatipestifer]WIT94437.1 tail protein [Riemerella phage vB_RanS_CRP19]
MTKEVLYTLNGKYFKDFGVFISESKGLLDKPKLKSRRSYDWAEYHGKAVDLAKPKYDEREIELKGWVEGETWSQMKTNFDTLLSEFDKEGLQRLVIEYLGNALVFDVYLSGGVELEKSFKEGKMVGVFTLKMKDPNPIKKVFKLISSDLQLSFNAQSWIDVNIDGVNETRKGNITINKTIPSRELSGYGFYGRNLARNTEFKNGGEHWSKEYPQAEFLLNERAVKITSIEGQIYNQIDQNIKCEKNTEYTISAFVKGIGSAFFYALEMKENGTHTTVYSDNYRQFPVNSEYKYVNFTIRTQPDTAYFIFILRAFSNNTVWFKDVKVEKGNKATDWTPNPEDTHYITISGNIDEITNLQTNAEELWSL